MTIGIPTIVINAERWSLFNPGVHDAHYAALRQYLHHEAIAVDAAGYLSLDLFRSRRDTQVPFAVSSLECVGCASSNAGCCDVNCIFLRKSRPRIRFSSSLVVNVTQILNLFCHRA